MASVDVGNDEGWLSGTRIGTGTGLRGNGRCLFGHGIAVLGIECEV